VSLLDELMKLNPRTRYLKTLCLCTILPTEVGDPVSALSAAEKLIQADAGHEDVLYLLRIIISAARRICARSWILRSYRDRDER